ncbi:YqaI family protein [Heyndrickxia sp. NPDC080065]|uniref:YqaI family protein n=1 Tax=Heyndrickxia sp. NPDC080065 TaxID=3390568 RepID=UPI003CFE5164
MARDVEHPKVMDIEKTSIPNLVTQPEHNGIDYFGNEILVGDSIVIDQVNGEVILEDSLEDYLIEKLEFQFTTAE